MKMNKTIVVDVDGPLAASDVEWLRSLESMTGVKLGTSPTDYDLVQYFREELRYEGLDGYEFWRMEDPYRSVAPTDGAIEACTKLIDMGYRLLPVSKVYTEHCKSKREWLKKWFPMLDEPIYISLGGHKSDIRCDYIIDDRTDNFKGFTAPTKGILFSTPYQNYTRGVDIRWDVCDTWQQIIEYFKEESYK